MHFLFILDYFQVIKQIVEFALNHYYLGRGYPNLSGSTTKKNFFMCVFPHSVRKKLIVRVLGYMLHYKKVLYKCQSYKKMFLRNKSL